MKGPNGIQGPEGIRGPEAIRIPFDAAAARDSIMANELARSRRRSKWIERTVVCLITAVGFAFPLAAFAIAVH